MDVDALAMSILKARRIRQKIVILCEGDEAPRRPPGISRSPAFYRQLDRTPDASFYKGCVPRHWHNANTPCFFNCGGRTQVLEVRERCLALHRQSPEHSYLSPEKLFVLVDWDLQPQRLGSCSSADDTEALWRLLYMSDGVDGEHRVWVTRLIHKEAFFLLSDVAHVVLEHCPVPRFAGQSAFSMEAVHQAALDAIRQQGSCPDADLASHVSIARSRLQAMGLDVDGDAVDAIAAVLEGAGARDEFEHALWSVTKAKPHWERITPSPDSDWTRGDEIYRDGLALEIARAIARMQPSEHAIAGFFEWLNQHR